MDRRTFLAGSAATSLLWLTGCSSAKKFTYASPSPVWWNAAPLIANLKGFYESVDLDLQEFSVSTGTRSKEAVITGNAFTGVAAPNSFSLAKPEHLNELVILSNTMQSNTTVSIVSREENIDWEKVSIGLVKGTISEFYLISYLRKLGSEYLSLYTEGKLNTISQSPPGVASSYLGNQIDVAIMWEPHASLASAQGEHHLIRDNSLYTQQIYLLGAASEVEKHQVNYQKMNKALSLACQYIENNREQAANELETFFKFKPGFLSNSTVWKGTTFPYSKSKSAITPALKADFEIAKIAGLNRVESIDEYTAKLTRFLNT